MYRNEYVASIVVNGKIQKESDDGTVLLPFGSEYEIRLKNKQRKRAVADVFIDGELACKGIVIDALGSVNLERFIDGTNLQSGNRFKIVKASDERVAQPNESENGVIKVLFYPEKEYVPPTITVDSNHWWHCSHHSHYYQWCSWCNDGYTGIRSGGVGLSGSYMRTLSSTSSDPNVDAVFGALADVGEAAATIQGSLSNQAFSTVSVDIDRSNPVTLQLKLRGVNTPVSCCGSLRKEQKFCSDCGKNLI